MTTAVQLEKKTISVIIIEDFKLTRVGLRCALNANEDIQVVAESDNALDGLQLIERHCPDIVLMDLGLAGMNGIEATLKVKEMNKDIKVIALTSHDREEEVVAALSSGAMAYCLKDIDPTKLADVIRDVVEGVCWLDPLIARKALDAFPKQETLGILRDKSTDEGRVPLTEREFEVLKHLVDGKSNTEIAKELTVEEQSQKKKRELT